MIRSKQKREFLRDAQRARDFERRSGLRLVAHHAVDGSAAEFDGSGLERAVAWRDSVLINATF